MSVEETGKERIWKKRLPNGGFHYATDPPIKKGAWVGADHPELLAMMGRLGITCLEEIDEVPADEDQPIEKCFRCHEPGVERHHTAPKKVFGADAENYPLADLCSTCHRHWHERMNQRAYSFTVGRLKYRGYYKLASAVERALKNDLPSPPTR